MATKNLEELNNDELLKEYKKLKAIIISNCIIISMLIGTSIYASINKGLGIFTFFPLFFIPILIPIGFVYKKTKTEVKNRGLI